MIITIEVRTSGEYTEQELKDFIEFSLTCGSIDNDNPFIMDEGAEITRVDID